MRSLDMRRIIITGMAGSGKSTLACQMAAVLDIEVFHMDSIIWQADWAKRSLLEWTGHLKEIVQKESWIIEGKGKLDTRKIAYDIQFPMADTIIFLDFNKYLCLWRICKRTLQCFGKHKVELSPEYPERFRGSLALLKRVWKNFQQERLAILEELEQYANRDGKKIISIENPSQVKSFLEQLEQSSSSIPKKT